MAAAIRRATYRVCKFLINTQDTHSHFRALEASVVIRGKNNRLRDPSSEDLKEEDCYRSNQSFTEEINRYAQS